MSTPRTLSIIGASEETVAHIRLLLRLAGTQLKHQWKVQDDEEVDLALIEWRDDLVSSAIQTRFQAKGTPYALICDPEAIVMHGMVLRQPLKTAQVVAVLNTAGDMRQAAPVVSGLVSDFYNPDLDELIPPNDTPVYAPPSKASHFESPESSSFYGMGDSSSGASEKKSSLLNENTTLEPMEDTTSLRGSFRRGPESEPVSFGVNLLEKTTRSASSPSSSEGALPNESPALLPELLKDGAIHSPTRISADGLPDVVLDPKPRIFYSEGTLTDLLPYASLGQEHVVNQGIAGSELQTVRDHQPSAPFDNLLWLFALAASDGHLDPSLDPGGSYSLSQALDIAHDIRSHARIAALMAQPMPPHEIARASGARMEDVFDIINAYHAIGRIKMLPRERLRDATGKGLTGALQRLFSRK